MDFTVLQRGIQVLLSWRNREIGKAGLGEKKTEQGVSMKSPILKEYPKQKNYDFPIKSPDSLSSFCNRCTHLWVAEKSPRGRDGLTCVCIDTCTYAYL